MDKVAVLLACVMIVSAVSGCGVGRPMAVGHAGSPPVGRAGSPPAGHPGTARPGGSPAPGAGIAVVRTIAVPAAVTTLVAADGPSLYLVTIGGGQPATAIAVGRVRAGDRGAASVRIPFPLAGFLNGVTAGPDGLYLGTSVIRRLSTAGDVLVRLDPGTLAVAARTSLPGSVQATAAGTGLWVSVGDGTVVRLDPRDLAIQASARLLPVTQAATGQALLSAPGYGLGSLWVLAGNEAGLDLVRLDPVTLVVRSRTRVPTSAGYCQLFQRVLADPDRVYLAGRSVQAVDAAGALAGTPYGGGELSGAALAGPDLVVTGADHTVRVLDRDFRVRASIWLSDGGGDLTAGDGTVWLSGDAGQGHGVVQIRLPG